MLALFGLNRPRIPLAALPIACLMLGSVTACKESASKRSDSADQRTATETNTEPAPVATAPATPVAPASDSPASPAAASPFHPVVLDAFYQRQFADYGPTESWAQVPRGETNFDGVPFLMFGKIDLTGLGRARDGEFQPPRIGEIPVERRAARLHLVHGASYDCPDGTPVTSVLLRYKSGEVRKLFIQYGVHVRNWYVEANEANAELSDPRSLVIWQGTSAGGGRGTPTRLFKTTLDNPLPAQEIRGLELLSLFARANSVFLAITLEDSPEASAAPSTASGQAGAKAPAAPAAPAPDALDNDDSAYRREDVVRVLDAETGDPLRNALLRLSVTERGRTYRFGTLPTDARGQVRIIYPPGKFEKFIMATDAPGYAPVIMEVPSDDGLLGPELAVRLRRQSNPPP
jgi:hypothetical protein